MGASTMPSCSNQRKGGRGFQSRETRAGALATRHVPARISVSSWALSSRMAMGGPPRARSQAGQSGRKKEAARPNTTFPGASSRARSTVHAASNSPRTRVVGTARVRKGRGERGGWGTGAGRVPRTRASRWVQRRTRGGGDVTGVVCGGSRTMFALLGVTSLVLIAGVPGGLRSAAGERRGVPAQAPGTGREAGRGDVGSRRPGRWLGGIRRPSGRPLVHPWPQCSG